MTLRVVVLPVLFAIDAGAPSTTQPMPGLTETQSARLLRARAIIENTSDSDGTRQGQAEDLLLTGWPAATDLLLDLLETAGESSTRVVICRAIGQIEAVHPEMVDDRMMEPLVRLMGDGDRQVSTAASQALSRFREEYVFRRLGALARDPGRPLAQRLAFIDALAPNIDRRAVIEQVLELLGDPAEAVRERAHAALAPASRVDYGPSLEAWLPWWQGRSALDEAAWLEDRVQLYVRRARELELRLESERQASAERYNTLSRRFGDVLRLSYRLTAQESQREELLIAWLGDPLVDFRRTALELIGEQIFDQRPPSDGVRAALHERFADLSPDLRRKALELVAALNDPADMGPILPRLAVETDLSVRETILGVLGKLRNPAAIPVLVEEISDAASAPHCVARAARSLAALSRANSGSDDIERAVGPLQRRLAATASDDVRTRGALLEAMASIGAAEFAEEFVSHLDSEQPELLLPAIRGVVALEDRAQATRLRSLLLHPDGHVRRVAVEAVGALDSGERPLESLVTRLNASTEPHEEVRAAAWAAFCRILGSEPAAIRLVWTERLKDIPGRQLEYLALLVADFETANPIPAELDPARESLVQRLREQKRHAQAARHLQELYSSRTRSGDPRAGETGVLLLDSVLRNGLQNRRIDTLLPELAGHGDEVKAEVVQTVKTFLDAAVRGEAEPDLLRLVQRLREAGTGHYDSAFTGYLDRMIEQLTPRPERDASDES